ncbi:MAG: hypothetical protein KGQ46_03925 [Hyphomicrobiales bacterium]|nr:hypothetical protein [Hyphomicrobiales bacterium]MDE2114960.1 hypothetical protein [Hyphomicrobiales bacterium]
MSLKRQHPQEIARVLGERARAYRRGGNDETSIWRRETFTLPREEARQKAREWFDQYPKAAYMTEVEFWRDLGDDRIEFTLRRLPSAD